MKKLDRLMNKVSAGKVLTHKELIELRLLIELDKEQYSPSVFGGTDKNNNTKNRYILKGIILGLVLTVLFIIWII